MSKQAGQLFKVKEDAVQISIPSYDPDDIYDRKCKGSKARPGETAMFVKEFKALTTIPSMVEELQVFEVYLFTDRMLQITQFLAEQILEPIKI